MSDERALADGFDLATAGPDFAEDPFPVYRALLRHAPVKRFADGSVAVARHRDLDRIYRDTATFSSDKTEDFAPKYGESPLYEHHTTSLVFNDPPPTALNLLAAFAFSCWPRIAASNPA